MIHFTFCVPHSLTIHRSSVCSFLQLLYLTRAESLGHDLHTLGHVCQGSMTRTRRRIYVSYRHFFLLLGYSQSHFSNSLQHVIAPKSLTRLYRNAFFLVQRPFTLLLEANIVLCKYAPVWKSGWGEEHQEFSSQNSWCSYHAGKPVFHGKGQNTAVLKVGS